MTADVDALQDRVSPSAIVERRKQAARSRVQGVRDKVMGTAHGVSSSASGTAGSAKDSAGGAVDSVKGTAQDAVSGAQDKVQGAPLAAGLIAFGAGLIVAALIPASEKEAVAAGHVVDAAKEHGQPVVDQAKSVAQDVVDGVKETAAEAAQEVKDTASDSAGKVQVRGSVGSGRGPLADPVLTRSTPQHSRPAPIGRAGSRFAGCWSSRQRPGSIPGPSDGSGPLGQHDAEGDHARAQHAGAASRRPCRAARSWPASPCRRPARRGTARGRSRHRRRGTPGRSTASAPARSRRRRRGGGRRCAAPTPGRCRAARRGTRARPRSRLPRSVVMPGMKPSTPTSRKTTPTRAAAAWTGVPDAVDRDRRRVFSVMAAPYPATVAAHVQPTPGWGVPQLVAQVTVWRGTDRGTDPL